MMKFEQFRDDIRKARENYGDKVEEMNIMLDFVQIECLVEAVEDARQKLDMLGEWAGISSVRIEGT